MRHLDQIKLVALWKFLCEWQFCLLCWLCCAVLCCVVRPRLMRPSSSFPRQYRHRQKKTSGGQILAQTSLRVLFTSSAPHSSSTFAFNPSTAAFSFSRQILLSGEEPSRILTSAPLGGFRPVWLPLTEEAHRPLLHSSSTQT